MQAPQVVSTPPPTPTPTHNVQGCQHNHLYILNNGWAIAGGTVGHHATLFPSTHGMATLDGLGILCIP